MTDTKNKEETFEFVINKCIEKARKGLEKEIFVYLEELHDELIEKKDYQIEKLQEEVKNLREIIDLNLGQINNKRKIISNLQAEVKELKIRLQNEYDEQAGSSL